MGLHEARGNLAKALKDLMARWEYTRGLWADAQSKKFEEEVLARLEKDLKAAVDGMDTMAVLVHQAKRDCGESY